MTMMLPSPFIDPDKPIASSPPTPFQLDEAAFWHAVDPSFTWEFEEAPMFISDPSPDFIAACHRDLLPVLERAVRLG